MNGDLNPYTPELELPIHRELEMVNAEEIPEAVYRAGHRGWLSALSYWGRKALSKLPFTTKKSLPLYYLDFLSLSSEDYVTQWDHIHPSHDKLIEESEPGHYLPAPFFVSGDGRKEAARLSKRVWRTPLYREQIEHENISRDLLKELSAFALSLALGRKLHDPSKGENPLEAPFLSCQERLTQLSNMRARNIFKLVLSEAQGAQDHTANELLEYITRRLEVRWNMDRQAFYFTTFLWSDEGKEIVEDLCKEFISEPLYKCLLGMVHARPADAEDLCRKSLEEQLSQTLRELAEGRGILRVEHKVQAICSLDKQVTNILASFEEVSGHQWEFLTRSKRALIEKQFSSGAVDMVDERIRALEGAIAQFEDLVTDLGPCRLDKIALIKELQESCDHQQRSEIAERTMMDFIRLHPNYEWRTHAEVLLEQIADDIDTLITHCLSNIPENLPPQKHSNLVSRLNLTRRNLSVWTHVGCDPRTCQSRLVDVYHDLRDSIAEEAPSLYTQSNSQVLAGLNLVGSLLETVKAFFPLHQTKA